MKLITGNTYPVKDQLKALGARWNPEQKAWVISDERADEASRVVAAGGYHPTHCKDCGRRRDRYNPIYRNGQCRSCWLDDKEEREMGY